MPRPLGPLAEPLQIAIIGDFNPASRFHQATNASLQHAADSLALAVQTTWLPTQSLAGEQPDLILDEYAALWCSPGSPYQSMDGALRGIHYARRRGRPFVGT